MLPTLTWTVDNVRNMLLDACRKAPATSIEDLLRGAAHHDCGTAKDAPLKDVLRALADNPDKLTLVFPAVMGMRSGDMSGEVTANANEAKAIADKLLGRLTLTGEKMNKAQMEAFIFPGVNLSENPQHAANFKEALGILVKNTAVKRFTSKDEPAEKRWETMQVPAKATKMEKSEKSGK